MFLIVKKYCINRKTGQFKKNWFDTSMNYGIGKAGL